MNTSFVFRQTVSLKEVHSLEKRSITAWIFPLMWSTRSASRSSRTRICIWPSWSVWDQRLVVLNRMYTLMSTAFENVQESYSKIYGERVEARMSPCLTRLSMEIGSESKAMKLTSAFMLRWGCMNTLRNWSEHPNLPRMVYRAVLLVDSKVLVKSTKIW